MLVPPSQDHLNLLNFCGHHTGDVAQSLQEFEKEPLCCFLVPPALDQNIQDVALLVHGTPKVMDASADFEGDFIEVPSVARSGRLAAQTFSVSQTELTAPFSVSLIA